MTRGQVNAVRAAFKAGVTPARIARQFGLSPFAMRFITACETTRMQFATFLALIGQQSGIDCASVLRGSGGPDTPMNIGGLPADKRCSLDFQRTAVLLQTIRR
jgi:hypothetical protein